MENKEKKHRVLEGVVTSDKMDKTVVVSVDRYVKHPKYQKFHKISKKYKAHDEAGTFKEGDRISIVECDPISKDKSFRVVVD